MGSDLGVEKPSLEPANEGPWRNERPLDVGLGNVGLGRKGKRRMRESFASCEWFAMPD